ncbi:MAG: hypothetical protein KF774_15500 [Planctomyces sp.]|nr:hypothetical protein [Planctomyces sp.]
MSFRTGWIAAALAAVGVASSLCGQDRTSPKAGARNAAPKAAPKADKEFQLTSKWTVLHAPNQRVAGRRPLPPKATLQNLDDLTFTGPQPGHPFVIGNFADDGDFGLVDGGIQLTSGANAALQLPSADQFELEGIMEQVDFGGWFFLVGWADGRGFLVSNPTMKESGSPWIVCELRGGVAIADTVEDLPDFEWRRSQPFRIQVQDDALTLEVGKVKVIDGRALANYSSGRVLLGVYDTRYGPKPIRIQSLRMRALEKNAAAPEKDGDADGDPDDDADPAS